MADLTITIPDENDILENGKILLFAKIEKTQGIWKINASDDDTWPSHPHAVRVDKPERLNLFDGTVYSPINREIKYFMSGKTMRLIYSMIKALGDKKIFEKIESHRSEISYL